MEKTYYIPKIQEFHVDFRYEVLKNDEWVNINDFSNAYEYEDSSLYGVMKDLEANKIRVKYLDREDIESLGFIFYKEVQSILKEPTTMFENTDLNIILGHLYKSNRICIITKDPSKSEIYYNTNQDPNHIAPIKIKNKSELQKLLKQLDI